jgi:hypothetical protein
MAISARLVRDAIIRISALINVLVGTDFNLIISWPETGLEEIGRISNETADFRITGSPEIRPYMNTVTSSPERMSRLPKRARQG